MACKLTEAIAAQRNRDLEPVNASQVSKIAQIIDSIGDDLNEVPNLFTGRDSGTNTILVLEALQLSLPNLLKKLVENPRALRGFINDYNEGRTNTFPILASDTHRTPIAALPSGSRQDEVATRTQSHTDQDSDIVRLVKDLEVRSPGRVQEFLDLLTELSTILEADPARFVRVSWYIQLLINCAVSQTGDQNVVEHDTHGLTLQIVADTLDSNSALQLKLDEMQRQKNSAEAKAQALEQQLDKARSDFTVVRDNTRAMIDRVRHFPAVMHEDDLNALTAQLQTVGSSLTQTTPPSVRQANTRRQGPPAGNK